MKLALIALLCTVGAGSAWALLGDTRDQAEGRYGIEKREGPGQFQNSLLHGCKEITFEHEGWTIRCALLRATDGNDYIVREEYRKIWNTAVYKAGGTLMIRDFERDAVIQAEGGNLWIPQRFGNAGTELYSTLLNHFTHLAGVTGAMWTRSDGAVARADAIGTSLTFDLPQAMKYEIALSEAMDRKAREDAARISGQPAAQIQAPPPRATNQSAPAPAPVVTISPATAVQTIPPLTQQPQAPLPVPNAAVSPIPHHSNPLVAPPPSLQPASAPVGQFFFFALFGGLLTLIRLSLNQLGKRSSRRRPAAKATTTKGAVRHPQPVVAAAVEVAAAKPRTMRDLPWDEFELLVGQIYQRKGYRVKLSAGTGSDGGVDLELSKESQRVLVQCKSWNTLNVGVKEIREFFGVLVAERADRGIFVTTGSYTRDALDFATGKPIEMIAGAQLEKLLQEASLGSDDDLLNVRLWAPLFLNAASVTIPVCPFCKITMVKRSSKNGSFWGCSSYPRCRGKRQLRQHMENCSLVKA